MINTFQLIKNILEKKKNVLYSFLKKCLINKNEGSYWYTWVLGVGIK